ncbi:conjugative transposon protein TraJ [Chitinophaga sp. XS-30]|uniref:conjugative transposon protein TraJ n=1 Tax=Chitinophaga sp. XS-30 TaxID=2604421 RepID=UPI0011DE4CCD|nr:conjugative transposon protein TraJ [Chitinophaga sp. XS-30]QEH39433.1 conjugative transposon protein TraJ [Chitinophaga sp. XS-30]
MKNVWNGTVLLLVGVLLPGLCLAQSTGEDIAGGIRSMHEVLANLKDEMLPLCADLINAGRAIGGFGATFYIGYRVWRHIANAEPVDVFPLLRPFVLCGVLLFFPNVIRLMDTILYPTVAGTQKMVDASNETVKKLFEAKEKAMRETPKWRMLVGETGLGDRNLWLEEYAPEDVGDENWFEKLGNNFMFTVDKMYYNFKNEVKEFIAIVLQILYEAVALCINTLRTFNLIILAILGPIVFGLSCFDGFTHTLNVYLGRYINCYLWLPVANIFGALLGKIQENMIRMDTSQIIQTGDSFFNPSDLGYIIFMIIGIVGYTTVPSISEYIVHVGSGGALREKVTGMAGNAMGQIPGVQSMGGGFGSSGERSAGMSGDMYGDAQGRMSGGMAGSGTSGGYFQDKVGR